MWCVMWCAWDVTRDASAQYLHPGACQFHAMIDAESDASCQAPWTQNSPQPSVPQPQPSVQMPSRYMKEMMEMLSEALADSQPEESDGPGDCVMLENILHPLFPALALAHRVVKLVSHKQQPFRMPSLTLALLRLSATRGKTKFGLGGLG